MKTLEILGCTIDLRTKTNVLYAQINIGEYLKLVGPEFDRFEIQRRKEKHKGYKRLKNDLKLGALIPPITLAIEPSIVKDYLPYITPNSLDKGKISKLLTTSSENIYILDGLQRTYIIKELKDEGVTFEDKHKILLEIWFESNFNHLIYRLIVLNSGQKPMSMRHQIELLFITMRQLLKNDMPDLKLIKEKDEETRSNPKEFPFDRMVTSYKCFLTKSPEIDKDNIIAEKMIEGEILDSDEDFLSKSFEKFKKYLGKYCQIDEQVFKIYNDTELKRFRNWMADSNVINSFFAAISKYGANNTMREEHIEKALNNILKTITESKIGDDPLFITDYISVKNEKADPKKYNVGYATRKILTNAFYEFFRDEGSQPFIEYWKMSSSEL